MFQVDIPHLYSAIKHATMGCYWRVTFRIKLFKICASCLSILATVLSGSIMQWMFRRTIFMVSQFLLFSDWILTNKCSCHVHPDTPQSTLVLVWCNTIFLNFYCPGTVSRDIFFWHPHQLKTINHFCPFQSLGAHLWQITLTHLGVQFCSEHINAAISHL